MSKTALITGITGQDGSYLAELLLDKGYIVHGVKRRSSSFNTQRIEDIYQDPHVDSARLYLHFGDLTGDDVIWTIEAGAPGRVQASFPATEAGLTRLQAGEPVSLTALRIPEGGAAEEAARADQVHGLRRHEMLPVAAGADGGPRSYVSFKLDPQGIVDMPEPRLTAKRPEVEGTVDVAGQAVKVKVSYSFETGGMPERGYQYVDADGDGDYNSHKTSREETYVQPGEAPPIYRINETYVSIKGIDLEIGNGEFVSIVGPSGNGKSTLLNMITGIDRPTDGEVIVTGRSVHQMSENELAAWRGQHVGIIFQFFQMLPALSLLQNIILPMDFTKKYSRREKHERAMQLLEIVGLTDQAHKLPGMVSGGQQQRVFLARALAQEAELLLLDEPANGLDPGGIVAMRQTLRSLTQAGKTVFVSSHILPELADVCTRVGMIEKGNLIVDGNVAEVMRKAVLALSLPVDSPDFPHAAQEVLVVLDGVLDPQNLGAIFRAALVLGATGLVLPRDRAAQVTPTVTAALMLPEELPAGRM